MHEYDKNILHLIEILSTEKKIKSKTEFYSEIKIIRQTISKIKKGINHFTPSQIEIICKRYNVNANWIFGLEKNIFLHPKNQ
jgi:DNA-binding Xre family transcriptional regulator